MVLAVVVVGDLVVPPVENRSDANATSRFHSGPISIFVVDTIGNVDCHGDANDPNWSDFQPPLTMWVRALGTSPSSPSSYSSSSSSVDGSEIFAGIALPHNLRSSTLCAWRYDVHPTYEDAYSIHVKVLTYDGFVDSMTAPCTNHAVPSRDDVLFDGQQIQAGSDGEEQIARLLGMNSEFVEGLAADGNYTHHRGVRGFKFYDIEDGCCTACTRARNCRMYSIPGASYLDECELYFDHVKDDVDYADRYDGAYLGRERNYSYTRQDPRDFPIIRGRRGLAISSDEIKKTTWPVKMNPLRGFPHQRRANETSSSGGGISSYYLGCGWSSLMSFER